MAVRPPATNSSTVVHPIGSTAGPLIRVVTLLGGVIGAAYVTMGGLEHLEPATRSYLQPLVFGGAVVPVLLAHAGREGAAVAARSLVVQLLAAALVFYAVMTIAFDDRPGPSLTLRTAVLVASCVEEVVFRILLPPALVAGGGGVPTGQRAMFTSIVASQLVFALCHVLPAGSRDGLVDPLDLGRLVAFGLVAWVAIALVGLWAAAAAHAALNIGVLVFGFHAMPTAADVVAAAVIGASGVAGVLAYRARMRPRLPRTPIDPQPHPERHMQNHAVRSTLHRVLGFALLMSVPACTPDSAPTAPAPRPLLDALPAAEQLPPEARQFLEDVQSRRDSVREVFANARAELAVNADALFGRRGLRTHATVCSGMVKELTRVLPKAEAAARDLWRPGRRTILMRAILQANDCPVPGAAHPSVGPQAVNASLSTTAVSESEFAAYVAENLRPEYWNAATAYGNAAPTDPGAYTAGMTEFERALFAEFVCEADAQYVAYGGSGGGGGSGSDPAPAVYSMFTTARGGCGGSAAAGCGAVVAAMWRETVAAAVWGGARCGWWCAIGSAAGSAALDCAAGAYGGYVVCQAAM